MALVRCPECGKDVSDQAQICPHCGCTRPPKAVPKQSAAVNLGCGFVLLLVGAVFIKVCAFEDEPSPAAPAAERPRAAPVPECRVSAPGSSGAVPLFPTEEGLDEFISASARGDKQAMAVSAAAHGAFLVAARTRCARVDVGFTVSKVRILEGPHAGKTGWAVNEFTMGR
jgi:hypothetical protein